MRLNVQNVEGILQKRGNSYRIQHYVGFRNGKSVYSYHKIEYLNENIGSNENKSMEIKKLISMLNTTPKDTTKPFPHNTEVWIRNFAK